MDFQIKTRNFNFLRDLVKNQMKEAMKKSNQEPFKTFKMPYFKDIKIFNINE